MAKHPKRRKTTPTLPANKTPRKIKVALRNANTSRRRGVIEAITARTQRARAQLDAFTAGVDMSSLDAYPVMTQPAKPKPPPMPKPDKEPRNTAVVSTGTRKPSPIRTRQNRCTYCDDLGHNARGCAERKLAHAQIAAKTATAAPAVADSASL